MIRTSLAAGLSAMALLACPGCLVGPAGSHQAPSSRAPGEVRMGVAGGAGLPIAGRPDTASAGVEGALWVDFGLTHAKDLRLQVYGQTWFPARELPWSAGGTAELKHSFGGGRSAVLASCTGTVSRGMFAFTPGLGYVFGIEDFGPARLHGAVRAAFGMPTWQVQLGAYLGLELAVTGRTVLTPELGTVCVFLPDDSGLFGCLTGLGAAMEF